MLVVRDTNTGLALSLVPPVSYKSLSAITTADTGFETMTVQVDATSVPRSIEKSWQGQEILFMGIDGTYWEGVIEQIQRAEGYYNVFAVGMQLWELAASALTGVYYDNKLESWKDTIEHSTYVKEGFTTKKESTTIGLGVRKSQVTPNGNKFGVEYLAPYGSKLKWLTFGYRRLAVPTVDFGGYSLRIIGYTGAADVTLSTVAITATDAIPIPVTFTDATGYDGFRIVIVKTTAGQMTSDLDTLVEITKPEISMLPARPTISSVLVDILSRITSARTHAHNSVEFPDSNITAPVILDGTQDAGQGAIKTVMDQLRTATGKEWFFGTYEGYRFHVHSTPRYTWSITARDVGEDAVYSAERGQPAVGGTDQGPITHVMARYLDTEGIGRYTAQVATGIVLPRPRVERIEATSQTTAVAEATARAALHATRVKQGTFVVKDMVRAVQGWSRNAASVRAGDWVAVDTLSIGMADVASGTLRGGLVGKTTYNGDQNEVTIELFGNGKR